MVEIHNIERKRFLIIKYFIQSVNDKFSDMCQTCYKWKVENSFGDMYNISGDKSYTILY